MLEDILESKVWGDMIMVVVFLFIGPIWFVIRSIKHFFKPEKEVNRKEDFVGFDLEMIMSVFVMMLIGAIIIIPVIIGLIVGATVLILSLLFG